MCDEFGMTKRSFKMGKSVTPKYRCEVKANIGYMTPSCWSGRATEKRLQDHIESLNESFLPGGINGHVSKSRNVIVQIHEARLVEQSTGRVVAVWKAPLFQVI